MSSSGRKRTLGRLGPLSPPSKRRQQSSPFVCQSGQACCICQESLVQLVQLGACNHPVCRGCMASHLLHAFKLQVLPLRCPLPRCRMKLRTAQSLQLLEQQVPGSGSLAAKALLAAADAAPIPDHLCYLCPYPDCQVPCELDCPLPDLPSDCPSCNRAVCATCRSTWHSGLRCAQYQALVRGGRSGAGGGASQQQLQQQLFGAAAPWQQQAQLSGADGDCSMADASMAWSPAKVAPA